jgi:hypothetical protein
MVRNRQSGKQGNLGTSRREKPDAGDILEVSAGRGLRPILAHSEVENGSRGEGR